MACFFNVHQNGVLTALAWLVPQETAAILAHSVYTIQQCTMSLHARHLHKVRAYLAITCYLHFRQNDWGLLHATAVTQGGTDTGVSQHRKLTLEKNIFLPLLQGFKPATF